MKSSKSFARQIAVVVDLNKDYDRRVVVGIGRYVRERGGWSVYLEQDARARTPDHRMWRGHGIIAGCDDPVVGRMAAAARVPVVGVGGFAEKAMVRQVLGTSIPYVATDNRAIGRLGAEYLMACGLRNFGFCGVSATRYNSWSRWRGDAFAARVRQEGYKCSLFSGRHRTARQWEDLQQELQAWIASLPLPAGIMASYDVRARHVLEACRRLERHVPEQIAVLGVDNDIMLCEMSLPPLSTVEQDPEKIGYTAAATLDRLMNKGHKVPRWTMIEPKGIVVRQSTEFIAVEDDLVRQVRQFIRDHVAELSPIPLILRRFGISRSSLDAHFKRTLGHTAYEEVQRVRLNTAKRLLETSDLPLKSVAHKSGFLSHSYLAYVFRRDVGMAPGTYRSQQRRNR